MKHTSVWLIIPQTNLHVGNESTVNFSVIDKAIQRDVTTSLPCINSSSLKGAVKEYFEYKEAKNIIDIFGSTKKGGDTQKGSAIFFDATLIAIPEQVTYGNSTYTLRYCEEIVGSLVEKAKLMGIELNKETIINSLGENKSAAETKIFKELCSDDNLPIIARNCLENGESANLWYEQVLPSQSVLATIFQTKNPNDLDILKGAIVQIGANATIGYGYCKFIKLS